MIDDRGGLVVVVRLIADGGGHRSRTPKLEWLDAEEVAGLEHVDGLGWHALRRKFADDLRDLPLKDLAAAGGWKRTETVVECYQSPDQERIREALEAR